MWLGGLAATVSVLIVACPPLVVKPFEGFSYASRMAPRVFVSHEPLLPQPGTVITIRLVPDLAGDSSVSAAFATLRQGTGAGTEKPCAAQSDGTFTCEFTLGGADGTATYAGRIELADGSRVASRATYLFSVRSTVPASTLVPVRVPVKRVDALAEGYRMDTALIRGLGNDYDVAQFVADAHEAMFDGILSDPVYRWRDDQLGFYLFTQPGITTSYYSGFDTRCGQNPWPVERTLPPALAPIEVIGVLHRLATEANAAEGRAQATAPTPNTFRDCAGRVVRPLAVGQPVPDIGTFSLTAGLTDSPAIVTHEFGHAAFGLGDEYFESNATRNTPAGLLTPPPNECCCAAPGGGGGVVTVPGGALGGGGTSNIPGGGLGGGVGSGGTCIGPGGQRVPVLFGSGSTKECTGNSSDFAPTCGASPQAACPTLAGTCVRSAMWLGALPAASTVTARPNVFPSSAECVAGSVAARAHPAVEEPQAALGTCRRLCGGADGPPCPCPGESEAWIVDIHPTPVIPLPTSPSGDLMASTVPRRLGGTCAWCVDTSLCVRWHRALGTAADESWTACSAPPRSATGLEAALDALLSWLNGILRGLRVVLSGMALT
jgi:hypothetical protein